MSDRILELYDEMMEQKEARIRELEAERDEAVTQMIEAKMAFQLLTEEYDRVAPGVKAGTHVIVPVEPTEAMIEAAEQYALGQVSEKGWPYIFDMPDMYRVMIRAAQPDKPQQGE